MNSGFPLRRGWPIRSAKMIPTLTLAFILMAAPVLAQAQEAREPTQEEYNKALAEQLRISKLRHAALDAADRTKIPHLKDFLTIYPDAVVRYLSFAGADFPRFRSAGKWVYCRGESGAAEFANGR